MNIQNLNEENSKVLVFTAKEIEKLELDREDDFRDEIALRINNDNFKELYSGWDEKNQYYIVVAQI